MPPPLTLAQMEAEAKLLETAARLKSAKNPARAAVTSGMRTGLGTIGALVTGGLATKAVDGLIHKFGPKPSLGQQIFGRGGAFRKAIGFGLGGATLAGGAMLANSAYDAVTSPVKRERGFKLMLADNPGLKEHDERSLRKNYNTLYNLNPDLAQEPAVASAFVKKQMAFKDEGIQTADVKTLSEIRKNFADARAKQPGFAGHFADGKDLYDMRKD